MIKESGNYLAVKVKEGYVDHYISNHGNVFGCEKEKTYNRQQLTADFDLRNCEVIGLLSKAPFNQWHNEIPKLEWNQWLIIKKVN
jgi:hypothetical protein